MTLHEAPTHDHATFLVRQGFVAVPLYINAVGHFETAAEVNGHAARLVLDTGASTRCSIRLAPNGSGSAQRRRLSGPAA